MAIIRRVREFCNTYNELTGFAHETNQSIHITNNGGGDIVLMSELAFEQLPNKAYTDYKLFESELRGGPLTYASESLKMMRDKVVMQIEQPQD